MKNIKRLLVSLVMLMAITMVMTVGSAMAAEGSVVKSETQVVADLGIMGGDGNGLSEEYLNKQTTRIQAAIMFLRLKGLEADAMAFKGTGNFKDANTVWTEGQTILAYLKANPQLGWEGIGDDTFNPLSGITAQQYYKVMLEALGFVQGKDYEYVNVFNFAAQHGLSKVADVQPFKNVNIVTATVEVLKAQIHDGGKTLAAVLSEHKKIDASKWDALQYTSLDLKKSDVLGNYLTVANGKTLYYFTKDAANLNSCVDGCLASWPVFYQDKLIVPAEFSAADFSEFTRADGAKQSTYKGWPLYYYVKDEHSGDALGDNVGKAWYVIKPSNGIAIGTNAELGNYLTDANGRTLYYYDKDTKGVSNCSGQCLANWPLFYANHIAAPTGVKLEDFGTLVRADGAKQTTYKGFPLYYWVKDAKHGDTTGQNVGKVWYVVDPATFSGTKAANTSLKTSNSDKLGSYLVDANGMTLYLFTKDAADPNACKGKCIENWPIFYDSNLTVSTDLNASDFGVLNRDDGTKQNTYKGWPLYYWIKDKNPGDTTGHNVGTVWFVLNPAKLEHR